MSTLKQEIIDETSSSINNKNQKISNELINSSIIDKGDDGLNSNINHESMRSKITVPIICYEQYDGLLSINNNNNLNNNEMIISNGEEQNNNLNQSSIDNYFNDNETNNHLIDQNYCYTSYNQFYTIENGDNYTIYTNQTEQNLLSPSYTDTNQMIYCPESYYYYFDQDNHRYLNINYYVNNNMNMISLNGFHENDESNNIENHHHNVTTFSDQQQQYPISGVYENDNNNNHHHHHHYVFDKKNEHFIVENNNNNNNNESESSIDSNDDKFDEDENKENIPKNKNNNNNKLNPKYIHQRFPVKLWNLASDQSFKPIKWSRDGLSVIINEHSLEPNLGFYFRSKKFSSFLRQLHLYGFRKVTRARNHHRIDDHYNEYLSEYQCNYFQRDDFDSVKKIRRYYPNNNNNNNNGNNNDNNILSSSQNTITSTSSTSSSSSSLSSSSLLSKQILSSQQSLNNDSYQYSIVDDSSNEMNFY